MKVTAKQADAVGRELSGAVTPWTLATDGKGNVLATPEGHDSYRIAPDGYTEVLTPIEGVLGGAAAATATDEGAASPAPLGAAS